MTFLNHKIENRKIDTCSFATVRFGAVAGSQLGCALDNFKIVDDD